MVTKQSVINSRNLQAKGDSHSEGTGLFVSANAWVCGWVVQITALAGKARDELLRFISDNTVSNFKDFPPTSKVTQNHSSHQQPPRQQFFPSSLFHGGLIFIAGP